MRNFNYFVFFILFMICASDVCAAKYQLFTPDDIIYRNTLGKKSRELCDDYKKCIKNSVLKRGEYESKEEFDNRKKNMTTSCIALKSFPAEIRIENVILSYNADRQVFSFEFLTQRNLISDNTVDRVYGNPCYGTVLATQATFPVENAERPRKQKDLYKDLSSYVRYDNKYFDSIKKAQVELTRIGKVWSFTLELGSEISKARSLKTKESSLVLVVQGLWSYDGDYRDDFPECSFIVNNIKLIDSEINSTLAELNL